MNYGGTKHYVLSGQSEDPILNIVEDRDKDMMNAHKPPLASPKDPWRAQSILIGAVKRGDKIIGVIEMINKRDANGNVIEFSKSDERLMQLLSTHCGIFIEQLDDHETLTEILSAGETTIKEETSGAGGAMGGAMGNIRAASINEMTFNKPGAK